MKSVFDLKTLTTSLGKKSAASFLSLVHSSRDELGIYVEAIEYGLDEGIQALKKRDDKASEKVSSWFSEISYALKEMRGRINSDEFNDFAKKLEKEAKRRPWFSIGSRIILNSFLNQVHEHEEGSRRQHAKLRQ